MAVRVTGRRDEAVDNKAQEKQRLHRRHGLQATSGALWWQESWSTAHGVGRVVAQIGLPRGDGREAAFLSEYHAPKAPSVPRAHTHGKYMIEARSYSVRTLRQGFDLGGWSYLTLSRSNWVQCKQSIRCVFADHLDAVPVC